MSNLIRKANLSFHKSALMVQALHEPKCKEWLWESILELNPIRNKIAHNLEYPQIDEMLETFIEHVRVNTNMSDDLDEFYGGNALYLRVSSIYCHLNILLDEIEN